VTHSYAGERVASLARVLADAERAAWGGDATRAWLLLRLAERMASSDRTVEMFAAAESVRAGLSSRTVGRESPTLASVGVASDLRVPRLRPISELRMDPEPASRPPVVRAAPDLPLPGRWKRRGKLVPGAAFLVVGLLCASNWRAVRDGIARGVSSSHPQAAVWILDGARDAHGVLLRGEAKEASGDTAGAVADYVAASSAGVRPGMIAWEAAVRLARLEGQEAVAADAFLEAYVAGIAPDRWDRIASVLERAGRSGEAERVRRGVGRR
jgi:hypothetical protein